MNNYQLFEKIYHTYFKNIYAYFNACFNADIADDLSQEVFSKVWKQVQSLSFREPENTKAWIFKIAVNCKNDFLRKKYKTANTIELSDEVIQKLSHETDLEIKICLEVVFSILRPQDKEVLLLHGTGLKSDEIGEILGISASTARSRLSVAKANLSKIMLDLEVK